MFRSSVHRGNKGCERITEAWKKEKESEREREEKKEPVVVMGSPVVRKTLGEGERFTYCIT